MSDDRKPVVFELPDGTEVSNDPLFHQQQFLKQDAENKARLQMERDAADNEDIHTDELDGLKGAELKALAEEEDVDIKGLTKVGEVKAAIREARAEKAKAGNQGEQD